jgi:GxxExxY protein
MQINQLTGAIIAAAVEVQRELGGPGLLERVYEEALAIELELRGLRVRRQISIPVVYKGRQLSAPLRLDMLVEDCVVVECKSLAKYNFIFSSQALTYIRLSGRRIALVINFGERPLRRGVHRIVNGLEEDCDV